MPGPFFDVWFGLARTVRNEGGPTGTDVSVMSSRRHYTVRLSAVLRLLQGRLQRQVALLLL
jgi:hypothetical protein